MDRSRLVLVFVVCFLPPPVVLALALVHDSAPAGAWVLLVGGLFLVYALLLAIIASSARSGERAVKATRAALPEALIVCRAIDEQIRPRGVRLFVADLDGVMMCNGRGARLKPKWRLPWTQIASASANTAVFKTGRKPALTITTANGERRTLGLVGAFGLSNPADIAASAAEVMNAHAHRHTTTQN